MATSVLKTIIVYIPSGPGIHNAAHTLRLPLGAVRWEVHQESNYGQSTIQFMAVNEQGEVLEIHRYAHGFWSKWAGFDREVA